MPAKSKQASPPAMQIAIVGTGGIGSAFAFQLARAGHHRITAIARPGSDRLEQMQRDTGIVNVKGEHAAVAASDRLDDGTPYDLIIVTLQAHRLEAVLPSLRQSPAKCILFMINNFEPERLVEAVGSDRCCFGMPFIQSKIDRHGRLDAMIGAGGQRSKLGRQDWVDAFNAAGLPAVFEPDMPLWLRCHVPLCIAFESISVAAMKRGGRASWAEAMAIAKGVKESFVLIQRLGYRLYPQGKVRLNASPTWIVAALFWAVSRIKSFRELLALGRDECCALVDVLLTAATRLNPTVSTSAIEAMKPIADSTDSSIHHSMPSRH